MIDVTPECTPRSRFQKAIIAFLLLVVAGGLIIMAFRADDWVQHQVLSTNQGHWSHDPVVSALSKYGDWPELMLVGGLGFIVARRLRNVRWQSIILMAMIASTLAGMTVNASRLTTGRTRPRAAAEQGWYGPYHDGKWLIGQADFNSFPSGHTATAIGFAGVILLAAPAWGISAMIVALAVALSRILLGAHHPSDVVTAAVISLAVSWAVFQFFRSGGTLRSFLQREDLRHWINSWRLLFRSYQNELLHREGVRVVIYDDLHPYFSNWLIALGPTAPVWKFIKRVENVILVDSMKDPRVRRRLNLNHRVKSVFLPLRENEIANIPKGCLALVPPMHSLEVLACKATFGYYLQEQGLEGCYPKVYYDPEAAEYPCVLKRTDLYGSSGVEIIHSKEELQSRLHQKPWVEVPYLIQAYVPGLTEYTAYLVCVGGRIKWHRTYVHLRPEEGIRVGLSCGHARILSSWPHLAQFEAVLTPLDFSGPCNIDYKIDPEGNLIILEINPRLGGGIMSPENIADLTDALECIIDCAILKKESRSELLNSQSL